MTLKKEIEEAKSKAARSVAFINMAFADFGGDIDANTAYFAYLFLDFPNLNIEDEIKQYHAWTLDRKDGKQLNHHSRFRQWLKKAVQLNKN